MLTLREALRVLLTEVERIRIVDAANPAAAVEAIKVAKKFLNGETTLREFEKGE